MSYTRQGSLFLPTRNIWVPRIVAPTMLNISPGTIGAVASSRRRADWALPANCELWLPFSYAGNANDQSGNANNYSLANDASVSSSGLNLDGTGDHASRSPLTSISSAYSVSLWVYTNSTTADVYIDVQRSNGRAIICGYQDGYVNIFGGTYPTGTAGNTQLSISLQTWTHFAWTINGSGAGKTIKGYRNGAISYTVTGVWDNSTAANAFIGQNGAGSAYFNGNIDDILKFSRVLSNEEISYLYTNSPGSRI